MARVSGPYQIVISGKGEHSNGSFHDANSIAARLVNELGNSGQKIETAVFVTDGREFQMDTTRKAVPASPPPSPRKPPVPTIEDVVAKAVFRPVDEDHADVGQPGEEAR